MKRNNFSIESKILGTDFNSLIEEIGGKTAGIELFKKISKEDHSIPNYAILPTKLSKNIDNYLNSHREELSKFINTHNYHENFSKVYSLIKDKLKDKEINNFIRRLKRNKIEHVHLRSSTTIEDWRDDQYYGTFETNQVSFSLMQNYKKKRINNKEIRNSIEKLFCDFFIKKFYMGFDLENESLGILGMESVGKGKDKLHVTVYSSYPEKDLSTGYIEIWKVIGNMFNDYEARQLVKISKKDIEVFQMNQLNEEELSGNELFIEDKNASVSDNFYRLGQREFFQKENPYLINGQRCALSEKMLRGLYPFSQNLQNILEKPVNLEIIFDLESKYCSGFDKNYVQLRPVPTLDSNREIKELKPLTDEFILIGETPFVRGSYKVEAPLILPKNKKSGHRPYKISEKFIMIDNNSSKGHRSYVEDSNVIALLYVDSCTAISHGFVIESSFLEREKWKSMGFINQKINLYRYLYPVELQDDFEGDGKRYFPATFGISKIPFILESDGREGRIYIRKKFEKEFNNPRPENEPLFKPYVNPDIKKLKEENLPF